MKPCLGLLAVALLVAGCGEDSGTSPAAPSLQGRTFFSQSVTEDGKPRALVSGTRVGLAFLSGGRLVASVGCNSMSTEVKVEAARIVIEDLAITAMGCPSPALHEQDEWLAELLRGDPAYALHGDSLTLTTPRVTMALLDKQVTDPDRPLVGTAWVLDGISEGETASTVPGRTVVVVTFGDGGRVALAVEGCNHGGGTASVVGNGIAIGALNMTKIACEKDPAEAEAFVLSVLQGRITYTIDSTSLVLTHPRGRTLAFRARVAPTAAS